MLHAHVYDTPPPLRSWRPDLPPGVNQVVMWALEKDPNRRPRTAGDFAHHLEAASGVTPGPMLRPQAERWLIGLAATAGVIILAALLLALSGSNQSTVGPSARGPTIPNRLLAHTCQAISEEQVQLCLR